MTDTSPFLLGAFAPVHHEVTAHRLTVTGRLPEELDGLFTQIGPSPIQPPKHRSSDRYRWFTQDGLVCGVRLRGGRAEWFRNRWIRSRRVARALGERRPPGPRHFFDDTVHTNVVSHGGMILALVETGCLPVRLSSTLDTVEYTDLGGELPRGFSAHPKLDPVTGELHVMAYSPLRTWAEYLVLTPAGAVRSSRRIPLGGRPMLHDIALTPWHVLFFDLPVQFSFRGACLGKFPYTWKPGYQARIGVLPRCGGELRWLPIPSCFVFHTINAREDVPGQINLTAMRMDRLFDTRDSDPLDQQAFPWQWEIDLASGRAVEMQLSDRPQELPRMDPRRLGQQNRFYYAVTADSADAISNRAPDALIKYDLDAGVSDIQRLGPDRSTAEPVFVPKAGSNGEDDGWVLHFRYDAVGQASELVVLEAKDFTGEPVATVRLPIRVPMGFHSSWIADL